MFHMVTNQNRKIDLFTKYCIDNRSIEEIVAISQYGIDYDECNQWGITGEQWQDALFVAIKELGKLY